MARSFSRSIDSDVSVEQVFAVLSSAEWPVQLAQHLGDDSRLVSREQGADGAVLLVMSRRLPGGIPGFLQKFLPPDPRVVTTDVWGPHRDGVREATWMAVIDGAPARISGIQRIEPLAVGNRHLVSGEVKVPIPLVGGRAESFIAEQVGALADAEAELVRALLG